MKDMLMRCEIWAEITGVQCFRRKVGAGSSQLESIFDLISVLNQQLEMYFPR